MNGLSGATVVLNGDGTVTKRGGIADRTRAQGAWIVKHGGDVFPKVTQLLEDGYTMEELRVIDYKQVSAEQVIELLRLNVWSQNAESPATEKTHELLVAKMSHTAEKWLSDVFDGDFIGRIIEDAAIAGEGAFKCKPALSHGDPTAENVMLRLPRQLVLTDPIPATEVVPDSQCVDIGKMLQSAYGWEHAKYGQGPSMFTRHAIERAVGDDELFAIGEAWATVHVMRALPYVAREMPQAFGGVMSVLERAVRRI